MSFETAYTNRRTRDILEDYDLALYATAVDGTTSYPGNINAPESLWLGLDYFGYAQNPGSNFVIATLEGGKRDYHGVDLIFRKRYSNNWQSLVSYTYNRAKGNTNSDSNADFQGDVLYLDPRAPNAYGRQPGNIPHVFKAAGSYMSPIGMELGAAYRWNSGSIASLTALDTGRNLPIQVDLEDEYEFNGATTQWVAPGRRRLDSRTPRGVSSICASQYKRNFAGLGTEVFVDIFNVSDNQTSIRNQDLVAGAGGTAFGSGIRFNDPRRFFLGARFSF